jgi:cytochrome c peroxidase
MDISKHDIQPGLMELPEHFPEMPFPENNQFTLERWNLGKKLFFEKAMSIDGSKSCASCHLPELAFSDSVALSKGAQDRIGRRNSPSLANVGYFPYYTREGGIPTLEMQVFIPIQEHDEFNHNMVKIVEELGARPEYQQMAQEAYERPFDAFVLTRALGTFERSLISGWSKYDEYLNGRAQLSEEEMAGEALFFSERLQCGSCHGGLHFTDHGFRNNGLYVTYEDIGRKRLTGDDADLALFKVPSLRNVAVTAPYMHDGSLKDLDEVLDHYNGGGQPHINKDDRVRSLNLSQQEKKEVKAFLMTLTDSIFISNSIFKEN